MKLSAEITLAKPGSFPFMYEEVGTVELPDSKGTVRVGRSIAQPVFYIFTPFPDAREGAHGMKERYEVNLTPALAKAVEAIMKHKEKTNAA